MTELPFVSVILPTLNRGDMLASLIDSLAEQTYPADRFEVIVVDNGSEDGTREWASRVTGTLPFRFRFLSNSTSFRVPAQSRNLGFAAASGEIIAFTDSDCLVSRNWLEQGVAALHNAPAAGLAHGTTLPWEDGTPRPPIYSTISVTSAKAFYETCNMFYRRAALERVSGFDRTFIETWPYPAFYGEDTDLAYRVLEAGYPGLFAPTVLVWHRVFANPLRRWIREPIKAFSWPLIVRRHPRIRKDLLFGRFFLTPMTALFDLGAAGFLLALFTSKLPLLLWIPFLVAKYREGGHHLSFPMRLVRVAGGSIRAVVLFSVLLAGSLYFRTLVI
jgi:glycosyltransferase involved in cell wall biosynthesis